MLRKLPPNGLDLLDNWSLLLSDLPANGMTFVTIGLVLSSKISANIFERGVIS